MVCGAAYGQSGAAPGPGAGSAPVANAPVDLTNPIAVLDSADAAAA